MQLRAELLGVDHFDDLRGELERFPARASR
jgi:hypothetical protein